MRKGNLVQVEQQHLPITRDAQPHEESKGCGGQVQYSRHTHAKGSADLFGRRADQAEGFQPPGEPDVQGNEEPRDHNAGDEEHKGRADAGQEDLAQAKTAKPGIVGQKADPDVEEKKQQHRDDDPQQPAELTGLGHGARRLFILGRDPTAAATAFQVLFDRANQVGKGIRVAHENNYTRSALFQHVTRLPLKQISSGHEVAAGQYACMRVCSSRRPLVPLHGIIAL